MTTQAVSSAGTWRWGLLFGVAGAVLTNGASLLFGYLVPGVSELVGNLVGIALFGFSLLLCGYAGYVAARNAGSPYAGNSAGLYAGLVYSIITGSLALLILNNSGLPFQRFPFLVILSLACFVGIYVLLALIAGIIGGRLAHQHLAQPE